MVESLRVELRMKQLTWLGYNYYEYANATVTTSLAPKLYLPGSRIAEALSRRPDRGVPLLITQIWFQYQARIITRILRFIGHSSVPAVLIEAGLASCGDFLLYTQKRLVNETACYARREGDALWICVDLAMAVGDHLESVVEDEIELMVCEGRLHEGIV